MSYNVKLDVFEGPLDLLLYFIKRDEINIYDIPIAHLTQEYLDYLQLMQRLNLHLAGEFILMAALLMRIKVQMLLPQPESEESIEVEDPRTELVQMLVEYQKYKAASQFLAQLEAQQSEYVPVSVANPEDRFDPDLFLSEVNLFDLGLVFAQLLKSLPGPQYYELEKIKVTINQQIEFIRNCFNGRQRLRFSEICRQLQNRIEVVVTFLAILEMIKNAEIRVSQKALFDDIWLLSSCRKETHVIANA